MVGIRLNKHFYWRLAAASVLVVLMLPILLVAGRSFSVEISDVARTVNTVLPTYLINTGILVLGSVLLTLLLGVPVAWIVSVFEFPFRKTFEWLLILPLAIPTFINAIAYIGLTDYAGPIQQFFRWMGFSVYLDIMNRAGAVSIMSFVLFPYVYVSARTAFLLQSSALIEVSRSLGKSLWTTFFRMALPLSWPAIFAGLLLV
ncbi:MAG: ABC transporter permease subunit, partial [Bacteroidota bacterium]